MSPIDDALRTRLSPATTDWQQTTLRRAAVLAPIIEHEGADALLFLVRASSLRQHAGQIAFPGGAADDQDLSPVSCALRETAEEIGVEQHRVTLLGSLPSSTSSSNYRVHCLVGRIRGPLDLRIDAGEVERLLFVPIHELLQRERWTLEHGPAPLAERFPKSPHFRIGSDVIWGLTGRFTSMLLDALRPPE